MDNTSQQRSLLHLVRTAQLGMVPNFANPHSLSQDVEITTRSEIAERTGFTSVVYDENSDSLKRDLDNLLRDTWAETLAETCSPRAKKHLKAASEVRKNEDDQLGRILLCLRRDVGSQNIQ